MKFKIKKSLRRLLQSLKKRSKRASLNKNASQTHAKRTALRVIRLMKAMSRK